MNKIIGKENSITQGNLWKALLVFFMPILLGSILQQSYNLIDALIIGNYAGKSALAAIDAPYAYIKLLINTFIALASGGSIVISQLFGAKDLHKVKNTVNLMILFSFLGGIIITILGIFLTPTFLNIMSIPKDIYPLSLSYLRIYFAGTIFVFMFNIASGILRALGDSKTPFYFLVISSILNILLDIIFVAYLKMGVAGAAFATVLAQGFSVLLIIIKMMKSNDCYNLDFKFYSKDLTLLKKSLSLGLPMAIQAILFAIANIYMQGGLNKFGTDSIAGWSICGKADFIVWILADTLGITVTTFVAQNYGANKLHRVKSSFKYSLILGSVLFFIVSLGLYSYIEPISSLFTSDKNVIAKATELMRIISPFYIVYMFSSVFSGLMRGRGNTFAPMIITLIGTCFFRIFWILIILPMHNSLSTVIKGYPWSWSVTALLFFIYYFINLFYENRKKL